MDALTQEKYEKVVEHILDELGRYFSEDRDEICENVDSEFLRPDFIGKVVRELEMRFDG